MKTSRIVFGSLLFLAWLPSAIVAAAQTPPGNAPPGPATAAVMHASNSPVYIVISAAFTTNAPNEVQFDKELEWCAFSDTNAFELNYPKPKYGIKISMTGPDGQPVQKSPLGKTYGTDFEATTRYDNTIGGRSMGRMSAAWPYKGGPVGGISFPAARDLFEMKTSGDYTMTVEMKMFRIDKHPNGDWTRKMLLFSPATIKVVKP